MVALDHRPKCCKWLSICPHWVLSTSRYQAGEAGRKLGKEYSCVAVKLRVHQVLS